MCSKVFGWSITSTTQTPNGLKDLLTEDGEHTSGIKKGEKLTISEDYPELP